VPISGRLKLSPKEAKERKALVDELGAIDAELALLKPKVDRAKYVRDVIAGWYVDEKPEAAMMADGTKYSAVVSAMGNKRTVISTAAVRKRLGDQEFMAHCSVGLGVLDELLTVAELPEFVKSERSGARTVKTIAKTVAKAA
jgi:hypothetical protein